MTEQARDWKYANPGYPNVTRKQLQVMNLMMQYDHCNLWAEERLDAYHELIMAVEQKYPGETRHETALRFIRERGTTVSGVAKSEG